MLTHSHREIFSSELLGNYLMSYTQVTSLEQEQL